MISYFSRFPFVRILLGWMIGILLSGGIYWPLLVLPCIFFPTRLFRSIGISALLIVFAMAWTSYLKPVHQPLPSDGFVFRVEGAVESKPKTWSVLARCLGVRAGGSWVVRPDLFRLYLSKQVGRPQEGNLYVVKQSIKPFAAPLFPFEKDWRDYYAAKGVGGTAYISADRIRLVSTGVEGIPFFENARALFVKILERAFEPGRDRDVAEAMLLGVKTKIDFETLSTYSALGAIHILSVSGLHVGLLYLGLSLLFGFLLKLRPAGPWLFFGMMLALLWCYAGISGFSLPVLRSAWMFSVILFAKTFLRRQESLNTLAFSAFVLLFIHPASLFDPGFQLSYLAVWGLIAFQQRWVKLISFRGWLCWLLTKIWELTCVALAAQVFTWPLIVYYFHQLPHPLSFLLLNPFLILFSSVALILGFVTLSVGAFLPEWAFQPLAYLLSSSFRFLHGMMFAWVERVTSVIPFLHLTRLELILYFAGIAIVVWARRQWKGFAFLWVIFVLIPTDPVRPGAYLSQYKGEAIWVTSRGSTSIASLPLSLEPAWIQSHLSPLWANIGVKDTLTRRWPSRGNVQWRHQGMKFAYVREPTEARGQEHLILGKEIKFRDSDWLKSWNGATWYFLKKPSPYWMGVLKPYLPKNYYFLEEKSAVRL